MNQGRFHQRRSIRLAGDDYGSAGAYFVTIGTLRMRCVFGRVEEGVMRLNRYGAIVLEEWQRTAEVRPYVTLDEFIVMPNHLHAILFLQPCTCTGLACQAPTPEAALPSFGQPQPQALPTIIGAFKSAVTRHINMDRTAHNLSPVRVWHRNYYERIIRDEAELNNTRRYIIENPLNWHNDADNIHADTAH
jgi:REP element-mobilizing transposase RayT